MRPRRSTAVVFLAAYLVSAALLFAVGDADWWKTPIFEYIDRATNMVNPGPPPTCGEQPAYCFGFLFMMLSWPGEIVLGVVVETKRTRSMTSTDWMLLSGINALPWATVITTAFVLIRRLRERRAASREV